MTFKSFHKFSEDPLHFRSYKLLHQQKLHNIKRHVCDLHSVSWSLTCFHRSCERHYLSSKILHLHSPVLQKQLQAPVHPWVYSVQTDDSIHLWVVAGWEIQKDHALYYTCNADLLLHQFCLIGLLLPLPKDNRFRKKQSPLAKDNI